MSDARRRAPEAAAATGAFALVLALAAADGGYFATTWGWAALGLGWAACLALVLVDRFSLGALDVVTVGALALLVAWVGASILWSDDVALSVLEVERDVLYVLGPLAALLIVREETVPHLLGGLLAAVSAVAAYALSTRLFPDGAPVLDRIDVDQLAGPIGYANGLGILCAIGALLALGFAARGESAASRGLAGAALPVLLVTLYFTFSRGVWVALVAALLATLLLDPRRLHLATVAAALAPWPVLGIWLSSREEPLTSLTATAGAVRDSGRQIALAVVALAAMSAAVSIGVALAERRVSVARPVRLAGATALAVVALIALVGVVAQQGGPVDLSRRAYDSFRAPPPSSPQPENDLNARLFALGTTYRVEQWRAAWHDYESHPWAGSGAGTFERYWLRHRPIRFDVRDAHSLYVEKLAELGWVGLALLAVALGTPLVAAVRSRRARLVPAAFAGYVAYCLHAGVDWDWELPAITLTALLCGVALLVSARRGSPWRTFTPGVGARSALGATLLAAAAFSAVGLLGNRALASATKAVDEGEFEAGRGHARTAVRWLPWSGRGWQQLGNAQLGLGDRVAARASLLEAARKSPADWSVWFDLGTASRGEARRDAYERAEELNPLDRNVQLVLAGQETPGDS